jgi:hypothetical protein
VADVFLSYSQKDTPRARQVAEALRASGWDVWWDVHLAAGAGFRLEIATQLGSARTVLVLWSRASIHSHFVIDEADDGRKRGVLVQAVIEDVELPLGFRQIQYANLVNWDGAPQDPAFSRVLNGIREKTSGAAPVSVTFSPTSSTLSGQIDRSLRDVDGAETGRRDVTPEQWQDLERRFAALGSGLRATLWRNVAEGNETWGVNGGSEKARRDFAVLTELAGRLLRRSPRVWARVAAEGWINEPDDFERWLFFIKWAEGVHRAAGTVTATNGEFILTEIDDLAAAAARACSECHAYELHG